MLNPLTFQEIREQLAADALTGGVAFATLISIPFSTEGGNLEIEYDVSASATIAGLEAHFRLLLDGAVVFGSGSAINASAIGLASTAAASAEVTGVAGGAHLLELQWRVVVAIGSIQCRPVTAPESEHATLSMREVLEP